MCEWRFCLDREIAADRFSEIAGGRGLDGLVELTASWTTSRWVVVLLDDGDRVEGWKAY